MQAGRSATTHQDRHTQGPIAGGPAAWAAGPPEQGVQRYRTVSRRFFLALAIATLAGLLLGVGFIGLSQLSVARSTWAPVASYPDPIPSAPNTKGSLDAPVVVTEWSDFQCSGCRLFALNGLPEFERLYVDTGKVRFVSRHYPTLGAESLMAAAAAAAAAEQGRYWAYSSMLWQRQRGENAGSFRPDNLRAFAAELGLDRAAFEEGLNSIRVRDRVLADRKEGDALGIRGTPTFFINGKMVLGIPGMDAWAKLVETEVAGKP